MDSDKENLRKIDYGSVKRQSLGKMIKDIYNEIPESETTARCDLANIQESLWYTAPEILNTIVHKVFHFLQTTPILNTPEIPQWLHNIHSIWEAAVSENNVFSPPSPVGAPPSDGS